MWRRLFRRDGGLTAEQVTNAARIVAEHIADEEDTQIDALRSAGFETGQAHRFALFLPMAFSRPVLEHLGVTEFSPTVSVPTGDGGWFAVRLDRQPEYVAGLALARRHRQSPCLPQGVFESIAGASADINAVSNALYAGEDIAGAAIASALVSSSQGRYVLR